MSDHASFVVSGRPLTALIMVLMNLLVRMDVSGLLGGRHHPTILRKLRRPEWRRPLNRPRRMLAAGRYFLFLRLHDGGALTDDGHVVALCELS